MTQPRTRPPTQGTIEYKTLAEVGRDIQTLFERMQPKGLRIFKTAPNAHELTEGESVLYDDESSTRRIYYKVNGTLRYANLT